MIYTKDKELNRKELVLSCPLPREWWGWFCLLSMGISGMHGLPCML